MEALYFFDLAGTFVFAISGTLSGIRKRFDFFGASMIGFVTAVGGGTVRDLLLGFNPVGWMQNVLYLYIILGGIVCAILFKRQVMKLSKALFLFDTVGIGVFTVLGLEKSLLAGVEPVYAIIMGMCSSVVGGVIRDTLCNEIPLIFRKEIYATVCLLGGLLYFLLLGLGVSGPVASVSTILSIIISRLLIIRFQLSFPTLSIDKEEENK
ncbi:trimeric intracellular cation channel family protein [Xanthovirga aplysinae]|uniref:trimeric intracellular cation channel family protein n=1 Tax=Xanthovirga aplysinae TaxID=2529853 RepID=UPI0012BB991D|nr:trimeric intracellular cation channel family protein [Xanthovirga aplysinae]MTI31721.1 trimeric intracellular cation channel family protein [Xanthovirga aplysinae]